MILVGDIGGTNARLAAFETEGNRLCRAVEKIYPSKEHNGLAEIVADFTRTEGIPAQAACFGVAGPVRGGRSQISKLSRIASTCWNRKISLPSPKARKTLRETRPLSRRVRVLGRRVSTGTDSGIILLRVKGDTLTSHPRPTWNSS